MTNEKIEIKEAISRLEQLQNNALEDSVSLEDLNKEIESINQAIVEELSRLGKKRKDVGLTDDEQELIKQLIEGRKIGAQLQAENKEVIEVDYEKELEQKINSELEAGLQLEEGLIAELQEDFAQLGNEYKEQYLERINKSVLGNDNEAKKVTGLKGVAFEMSRINLVANQGKEELMEEPASFSVEYDAYPEALDSFTAGQEYIDSLPEKLKDKVYKFYSFNSEKEQWNLNKRVGLNKVKSIFSEPEMAKFLLAEINQGNIPMSGRKSEVDIDVPIKRTSEKGEEIPYVYETKAYPRRIFGQMASNYNQLLKYNEAVSQNLVDGASVEIEGRVDPGFLKWAAGASIEELGAIPNVEVIYNLPLPSGNEYRFVLKRTRKENGLAFSNDDKGYTDEDKRVIAGIQKGIVDKSILNLLSEINVDDFDGDVKPFVANPSLIDDAETYYKYEALYKNALWKNLLAKSQEGKINVENKRSATSEYANEEYVTKIVTEYQAYLSQNPEMAKVKKNYIVSEDRIPEVVNKAMEMINRIRDFEIARQNNENERARQQERERLGYKGNSEGVALDIEHIMIDAIQDINRSEGKAGRSYDEPERFKDFAEVSEELKTKKSQRYIEIESYDPETGKMQKQRGLSQAQKLENELISENLKRLEKKVAELEGENKRDKAIKNNKPRVEKLKAVLADLNKSKGQVMKEAQAKARETKDFSQVKELSERFMKEAQQIQQEMIDIHIETIGGKKEYDKIAKRVNKIVDQDIAKFIYTVNSDESIIMDEEVIRSDVSGRAAHSELAQGRNVYGAGEMVFSKHNEVFKDYEEWKKWNETADFNQSWKLTEINNGSGHYRPSVETLKYVENLVKKKNEARDLDISQVKLNDTIMRGLKLKDAGVFV